MTTSEARTPSDVLREARDNRSSRKRNAVFQAVDKMRRDGSDITFASVARAAQVSQWLVYAEGVREYITAAMQAQSAPSAHDERIGRKPSVPSLRTDLELARQDIKALRHENARLKTVLRERLGEQLEAESAQSLRLRIDHLSEVNNRLSNENSCLSGDVGALREQLTTAEDDLAAARASLRRMIKSQTADLIE